MAQCCGIGKGKVVPVQKAGHTLSNIGGVSASRSEVVQEATSFKAECYGEIKSTTMTDAKRSHFQQCIWRHADESSPQLLGPLQNGWMRGTMNKILTDVMLPTSVPLAPEYIMRMMKLGVRMTTVDLADAACVSYALLCTVFCWCDDSNECLNSRNASVSALDYYGDKEND